MKNVLDGLPQDSNWHKQRQILVIHCDALAVYSVFRMGYQVLLLRNVSSE